MNSYMHYMHPPKIVQIGWGYHVNFCVLKKSAITFGEGCITNLNQRYRVLEFVIHIAYETSLYLAIGHVFPKCISALYMYHLFI